MNAAQKQGLKLANCKTAYYNGTMVPKTKRQESTEILKQETNQPDWYDLLTTKEARGKQGKCKRTGKIASEPANRLQEWLLLKKQES